MARYTGWLYCSLWYFSILAGYAGLYVPLLPIVFLSNRLYRMCTDVLFTFWQLYPTILLETLCGCEIQVSGDAIRTTESALLLMNHRTRTDWNFLWPALYHCIHGPFRFLYPTKFILKHIIRHIPGPGWVMQLSSFVYIRRCWSEDQRTLRRTIAYFAKLRYKFTLLLFPEGTDLTPSTKARSDNYAAHNKLPTYSHVLHPRSTGFVFLAQSMLQHHCLDAVYDATLVYPDQVPQTERHIWAGNFPKLVKIHLARYPKAVLPRDEQGLKDFLAQRWQDKEKTLKEYHATGNFLHGPILRNKNRVWLVLALVFWTLLPPAVLLGMWFYPWYFRAVMAHSVFLVLLNIAGDGFQQFEISLFLVKKILF